MLKNFFKSTGGEVVSKRLTGTVSGTEPGDVLFRPSQHLRLQTDLGQTQDKTNVLFQYLNPYHNLLLTFPKGFLFCFVFSPKSNHMWI